MIVEARAGEKQWVALYTAIDQIVLTDEHGGEVFNSPIPWLTGRLDDGRKVDVVGVLGLKRGMVVDDVRKINKLEPGRPIFVRGTEEVVDVDDKTKLIETTTMILPLRDDQFVYLSRAGEYEESLVSLPGIVEDSRASEPTRFRVERFIISRWVRL